MSRIGKLPVAIPPGVRAALAGDLLTIEGPRGKMELRIHPAVAVTLDLPGGVIAVALQNPDAASRKARKDGALWGTTRRLISNMTEGVTTGYSIQLQVIGVGYTAKIDAGKTIILRVGYANDIRIPIPPAVTVKPPETGNFMISGVGQMPCTTLTFESIDKQLLGQFAASVRHLRRPEPYKGKGIRYLGEEVKRKAGKALAAGAK